MYGRIIGKNQVDIVIFLYQIGIKIEVDVILGI